MRYLLVLLCGLIPSLSFAIDDDSDWYQIISNNKGEVFFMPLSFAYDEFGQPNVWLKFEFKEPIDGVYAQDLLYVANCENRKLGASHIVTYDKDYNVIEDAQLPTILAEMNTFRPQSFESEIHEYLCYKR